MNKEDQREIRRELYKILEYDLPTQVGSISRSNVKTTHPESCQKCKLSVRHDPHYSCSAIQFS